VAKSSADCDINEINNLVAQVVALYPASCLLYSFSFMLFYSWKLTLAVILIAGLMTVSTLPLLPVLRQRPAIFWSWRKIKASLVETLRVMVIKATNAAPQFWEEFQSRFGRLANLSRSAKSKLLTALLLNLLAASAVLFAWIGEHTGN